VLHALEANIAHGSTDSVYFGFSASFFIDTDLCDLYGVSRKPPLSQHSASARVRVDWMG